MGSALRKPGIPAVPKGSGRESFDSAIKESLETIMGRRGLPIRKLPANADLDAVIAKINEIVERLQ